MIFTREGRCAMVILMSLFGPNEEEMMTQGLIIKKYNLSKTLVRRTLKKLVALSIVRESEDGELTMGYNVENLTAYELLLAMCDKNECQPIAMRGGISDQSDKSTYILLEKEIDRIENTVIARLKQIRISSLSERASKIVFI